MQLLSSLQDSIIEHLESDLGPKGAYIDRSETEDEIRLGNWIADNMGSVARHPHLFVYTGTIDLRGVDSTMRMPQVTLPVRVFVMTRDASSKNEEAQKRLADKWSLAAVSSLHGARFGDDTVTNDGLVQDLAVNPLGNGEDAAMWEVSFNLDLNIDLDLVLNNI